MSETSGVVVKACTCGGTWPCTGPAWMGDHNPVVTGPVTADVAALLDRLEQARAKGTPGPWQRWDDYPVSVLDRNGDSVATCEVQSADAALIAAAINALPGLVAAVRGVAALAEELETCAKSRRVLALDADAAHASEEADFLRDRADDEQAQADRIRAVLAAALDGEAEA